MGAHRSCSLALERRACSPALRLCRGVPGLLLTQKPQHSSGTGDRAVVPRVGCPRAQGEWHWDLWGHSHGGLVVTGEGAVRAGCPHGQSLPLPFPWSGAPKYHPKALPSALRTWILLVTWTLQGCPGVFSNKTTIPY